METTVMKARLSDLQWRNATDREVSRLVSRSRGDDRAHSRRGFGPHRKRNEVAPNLTSYRDGWYWDSFTVAAGAAFPVTNMFATPQGSGGKTLAQTNLTGQGGQLPSGQTLLIRYIRVYISNVTVPADFQNILSNCSVQFKVNNTPIYQFTPGFYAGWLRRNYYRRRQRGHRARRFCRGGFDHQRHAGADRGLRTQVPLSAGVGS